jgi:hypothetical protein
MNFDEKMAEEYEENAEYIEIDDYGHKVYGSLDIEQAFLDALRKGSQLDKVYDASEDKWINRHSELEKKYDTCLRENTGLKIHNTFIEKKLSEAKEIIQQMLRDIPNRMWYTDETIKQAEQFLQEDNTDHFSQLCKIVRR